jgi:RNA polymerase sigma-70 factor, ECF subfamily
MPHGAVVFRPSVPQRALLQHRDAEPDRSDQLAAHLERYRAELTGYCYRMLGSAFEAEDAVQEVLIRAWRAVDRFEGRSALRSWLYSIATNVCLDMLGSKQRRALPMDLAAPSPGNGQPRPPLPEATWVEPIPDGHVLPRHGDPAELAVARESVRLAFVAALQHLPPRQRAVLILRDVLRWHADEVAELLDTTVVSVKSTLQRARATLAALGAEAGPRPDRPGRQQLDDGELQRLLDRYIDAFERLDMDAFVSLLREDAIFTMPPNDFWLQGIDDIRGWWVEGQGRRCAGHVFRPVAANGCPAFAIYRSDDTGGAAFAIQVLELSGDRIGAIHTFIDPALFPLFGLPATL